MQPKQKKQQNNETNNEQINDKKQPKSLEEGIKMGLSKQQLRKLQKKLKSQQKKNEKKQKQEQKIQNQLNKQKNQEYKNIKKNKYIQITKQYLQELNSKKIIIEPNLNSPKKNQQNILITSALPYVNNVPHLGNIIGCVLSADVYARYKRLQGANVLYICGTDQYGTATQIKAMQQKKTPQQICNYYHQIHRQVYEWFDINFDHFGRTTTQWHSKICQQIFLDINKANLIKKQTIIQCYCVNCDLFLADRFISGTCPNCGYTQAKGDQCDGCQKLFDSPTEMIDYYCHVCHKQPILKQTQHFFIDLPKISEQLNQWVNQSSIKGQWSNNSVKITKAWIKMGLKPKCITRDLKWGVNLPLQGYQNKVFYVWYDAPIGYISITANLLGNNYKEWWNEPKNVKLYQFMGKDNVPFHTVVFPSSLLATKQIWTLLHHISTTEYLNYEGTKFSKRNNIGVFGDDAAKTGIPSQVWRYYLLVNRPENKDSQFYWQDFIQRNNNQLLANLGNLCQRSFVHCYVYHNKQIPKEQVVLKEKDQQLLIILEQKYIKYKQLLDKVQIKQGMKLCLQISSLGNKYLQDVKFWEKNNRQNGRDRIVMYVICRFIRFLSMLLQPFMPSLSAKINFLLGCKRNKEDQILGSLFNQYKFIDEFKKLCINSQKLQPPTPLFKQYTQQEINIWKKQFQGTQKKIIKI